MLGTGYKVLDGGHNAENNAKQTKNTKRKTGL